MKQIKSKIKNTLFKNLFAKSSSIIFIIIFTLILISNQKMYSQSVDSLINEAISNNSKLKSLESNIKVSEYRSKSVNNLPPPNLSVEFSQVPIKEYDILNKSISNSIALSQMFPIGGKLSAMAEVENKNTLVEKDNFNDYKINLIAQIKMSYYSLWLADRKIEIQKKNIVLLNEFVKSLQVSFYTNKITQADLLTVQSEISSDETQLLIFEKQREAEIYKLNRLLGRNLNSTNLFAEENLPDDSLNLSQSYLEEILTESNPTLARMNNMIEMNKAMINANKKELIPDLMVQGMLMRMPRGMILTSQSDMTMLDPKTEIMYSLMFSINLPFAPWSVGKINSKEEELSAGINSIENQRLDMQREMTAQLKEALVKYSTANELAELYDKKVIPAYTSASESQTTAYQNGKTSISSVIDSYRMLLMQEMNYYMSKADVQMALAEIEMMVGTDLKKISTLKGN